jgi:hypothetical protein
LRFRFRWRQITRLDQRLDPDSLAVTNDLLILF